MKKELPERKPLRLKNYDYSTPGAYFITICTHNKKNILSKIVAIPENALYELLGHTVGAIHESPEYPEPKLTVQGRIVDDVLNNLPSHLGVEIAQYVIMPNHIHLVVVILDGKTWAIHESPLHTRSIISKTIGYIKMNTSKEIHRRCNIQNIWQRGYHDHIIRDTNDYEKISKYIYENPLIWQYDRFYSQDI